MPRPNAHQQTLKHLAFFEVLASAPEGSDEAKLATAGLLSLRMIDHWVLAGPAIVEPESVSVRSVRQAIMALPPSEPVREALLTIVNTMQMLRQVDLTPVLPRVFAYGQLLERHHGSMVLATDAYQSVVRLADPGSDAELIMDAYQRASFCERKVGKLDDALASSQAMAKLARRRKDRVRTLRAKMGMAQVAMMRGDLPAADSEFVAIAKEARDHELLREYAMATHNRSVVAARSGNSTDAILLAHEALASTSDPVERDRVLSDLAAMLIQSGRYDAAIDALRVLEVTASSEEPRLTARANIVIAAARAGDRRAFDTALKHVAADSLPLQGRLDLLIETALGLRAFGEDEEAARALASAEAVAREANVDWALTKIQGVRDTTHEDATHAPYVPSGDSADPTHAVAAYLKAMATSLAA